MTYKEVQNLEIEGKKRKEKNVERKLLWDIILLYNIISCHRFSMQNYCPSHLYVNFLKSVNTGTLWHN